MNKRLISKTTSNKQMKIYSIRGLIILFSLFLTGIGTAYTAEAQSRPGNTELGIILGEPTGISLKVWQSNRSAFDAALAWSFGRNESIHIHANYLIHEPLQVDRGSLMLYYGIGARTILADDPKLGVRIPVGLQYIIPSTRLSLFFEVAPILDLIPGTSFGVNGGLGVRYFL